MVKRKASALAAAVCGILVGVGGLYASSGVTAEPACEGGAQAARCGKCGDGQCVRQCGETATSCPRDCGGVPADQ